MTGPPAAIDPAVCPEGLVAILFMDGEELERIPMGPPIEPGDIGPLVGARHADICAEHPDRAIVGIYDGDSGARVIMLGFATIVDVRQN